VFAVTDQRFDEFVDDALHDLPDALASAVDNVAIVVDRDTPAGRLLGLYHGIPLTKRDSLSYSGVMPDTITLYQQTICAICATEDDVRAQVRKTVLHEIGHYFGINEGRLGELGWG
jgi:predicted Zn-dependent protease with MMP-like domain